MATITRASKASPRIRRIDVNQYLTMIVLGILPHDARVELLDGILVEQMTRYPPHTFAVSESADYFRPVVPAPWAVREEKPLVLGRSWRPEPDVAIVRGPKSRFRATDPRAPDVGLLVEVAESTYASDRGEKWRAYAAARVPIYWIVNLNRCQVEVYTDPAGRGKSASYRQAQVFGPEGEVPVVIDGQEVGRLAVRDILP